MKNTLPYVVLQNNNSISFNQNQVNSLVKIGEFTGSNVELVFKLKNNTEISGFIEEFEGYNCLVPADIFIPIVFKVKASDKLISIDSVDLCFVEAKTLPLPRSWSL